jgi:hypothetical protein
VQPEGVIIGGWNYVVAAYVVTAAVLVGYAWSLRSRLGQNQSRPGARERDHG